VKAVPVVIHRVIPILKVDDAGGWAGVHTEFPGLEKEFDLDWIASSRDPDNRSAQVSLVSGDMTAPEDSAMTVHVADVEGVYARARELGYEIVYPLTDEPWGVRRFFVRDPTGTSLTSRPILTE
jgi:catechol 2,3-dioxygenase-like lactoylglutathione lyase family enzyme